MSETTERYTGHTPGPWRRAENYRPATQDVGTSAVAPYILCADGRNVAAAMIGGFDDMAEVDANANLLADAPALLAQLTAALQENERLKEELAGEERSRDLHADLNRRSAKALGKPFEGAGSSWHDIPECIAALRSQLASGAEELKQEREHRAKDEALIRELQDEWARKESTITLKDHPQGDCPTWYDGCHCTVDYLRRTEARERALEKALRVALGSIVGHDNVKLGGDFPACGIEFPVTRDIIEQALSGDTPTTKPPVLSEEG